MKYKQLFIQTETIRTAYYRTGEGNRRKLLVLHGNFSSSVFFMPLAPALEDRYDIVAPDLRCFGNSEARDIDASRGYRDWSDDVYAFCKALGWKEFYLLGWSLGGDVAMQFTIDHSDMVKKLILVAPGSPYGFGGTKDEKGKMHHPAGLGSGAGTTNPLLTVSGLIHNEQAIRSVLYQFLFRPPFRLDPEWEEEFTRAAASMKTGPARYPGNFFPAFEWPHVVAGDLGVLNTMSPRHGKLTAFLSVNNKPPVLWVRGDADMIVSDNSMMEFGNLGKMGLVPGWPGEWLYPPQPMVSQTRYFLNKYRERGGIYIEAVIPGGHLCILESPIQFISALDTFIKGRKWEEAAINEEQP